MVNKTTKYKKGKKKKTQHLVTVKCDDPDKFLNISTRFEYDDAEHRDQGRRSELRREVVAAV